MPEHRIFLRRAGWLSSVLSDGRSHARDRFSRSTSALTICARSEIHLRDLLRPNRRGVAASGFRAQSCRSGMKPARLQIAQGSIFLLGIEMAGTAILRTGGIDAAGRLKVGVEFRKWRRIQNEPVGLDLNGQCYGLEDLGGDAYLLLRRGTESRRAHCRQRRVRPGPGFGGYGFFFSLLIGSCRGHLITATMTMAASNITARDQKHNADLPAGSSGGCSVTGL